jgi:hypothetical protein
MKPEQIALVCDYLRTKDNPEEYVNDEAYIASPMDALELLDHAESMNFAAIGEAYVSRFFDAYLNKAIDWKAEIESCNHRREYEPTPSPGFPRGSFK